MSLANVLVFLQLARKRFAYWEVSWSSLLFILKMFFNIKSASFIKVTGHHSINKLNKDKMFLRYFSHRYEIFAGTFPLYRHG